MELQVEVSGVCISDGAVNMMNGVSRVHEVYGLEVLIIHLSSRGRVLRKGAAMLTDGSYEGSFLRMIRPSTYPRLNQ